jgi:signal transduction histidine kinase/CheY-like chemotaxis protein
MWPADPVSERELGARWYPLLRLGGFSTLAAVAVLHNVFVLERYSAGNLLAIVGGLAAWLLFSWLTLRRAYVRRRDLAVAVQLGDAVAWTLVIYLTGAERSLLVFLVLLAAADIRAVSFRRVLFFGHFSIACYVLLLVYVAVVDKHRLEWPAELVKVGIFYIATLYLAYRAKMADALRATRRRAREAQTAVLANVSHELRTPLNGVIGGTRLLESTDLTPAQRHHVAMVRSSAEAMLGLIEDVLDFSKLEASKLTIEPIAFALRATLAESLRPLTPRADAKGLVLRVRVAADVPDALVGDSVRLRQIVVNLVANAIKFTDDGEVELRATLEPDGDTIVLHLAVRDTGIGIPADRRQAIFEAFTQADGSTTRTHGGTGLGLTIASRLAELMGGRLWVESDLGRGSTFHATVRCRLAPPRAEPTAPGLAGAAALVAEPNGGHRATLVDMLHGWGMVTTQAESGAEVVASLARGREDGRPFDVLFLGIDLIGMDGLHVVERLRAMPDFAVPIVMLMRAVARRGDRERCAELGVSAVLTRPFSQSEVFDALTLAVAQPSVPAPPRRPRRPLSVLLADDNPVNREIAVGYLVAWGHAVTSVADGLQALALLERGRFDAAVLDVHMPGADGFDVTREIRRREAATGGRLAIVAMTARALEGDRERCLDAGMDDYVAKPVDADHLFDILERVTVEGDRVVFGAALLERAGGDAALQQRIAGLFLDHVPQGRTRLREALARGDAAAAAESAHWLKGAVGNFPAPAATEAAARVEKLARAGDLEAAALACATLDAELDRLAAALAAVVDR